ncbi:1-propanol dehydrogenase PduQ [Clostridium luticellarii]|jgi:alcohol dehydrogenase class IV|uniref:Aldehyde-alcohol dehydrogenase n=1 Tax=Clostridium luticellarii TaxID=1691940 RepID=A0A2T0BN24_9CLOT|nr:1-propanol dehydrogenase PduQ [Clostridium luticellarii]MCI1945125.1 iron-containing alcohol dehydrogenase [Clostridium luticellarii]MCI1968514.1 iron-containing alcohol dehydrogenase [Clostridium luticellarii]MCI1995967.1 iron-containing alcohol dehydrogenase [Clostridium luticellarii]MCI2040466.1 iron-containing alcohol dehydrogenase [Clostridium luticellarii]PRR85253.1 Aldehyde-alcohol dehydrogenase [Clostridium luticellarii]
MNIFKIKPVVYFDMNSVEYLKNLKEKKSLIITDPFMVKAGFINKVTDIFRNDNVEYKVFSGIRPDPPVEVVAEGAKEMIAFKPDVIVALGGGSSIDAAKSILAFTMRILKDSKDGYRRPLFIAIPTTSGTGSEVTSFSIITTGNKKVSLIDDDLIPDVAILDASFVKTVPGRITADTGIDVFTHGIEAYVSNKASDFSDALAEQAMKLVIRYLPEAYKNGDNVEAREKLHNASCMAGMAFTNASLGINHSMAHILGGIFHIPHGRANAILLPYVIKYNADLDSGTCTRAALRYRNIAEFLGLPCSTVEEGVMSLICAVNVILSLTNTPRNLKEAGIDRREFFNKVNTMAEVALEDRCTPTSPRIPSKEELIDLFKKAYGD